MKNRRKKCKQWQILFSWTPKSMWMVNTAMELKKKKKTLKTEIKLPPWKESHDKPSQCIKKQRHHFYDKDPYSQNYAFSNSHVQMWKLDHEEDWVLKNWCFWIVVLEKAHASPLDSKELKPINTLKEINPEYSLGGLLLKLQYFGHMIQRANSLGKLLMLGKIEGRKSGWQRMRWLDRIFDTMDKSLTKLWI